MIQLIYYTYHKHSPPPWLIPYQLPSKCISIQYPIFPCYKTLNMLKQIAWI